MNRRQIHIAGIQETLITRNIDIRKNGYRIITSAAETERGGNNETIRKIGGVALSLEPELADMVRKITRINNKILTIALGAPENAIPVTITTAYAPHTGYRSQLRAEFRNNLREELSKTEKRHLSILLIDANGQVQLSSEKGSSEARLHYERLIASRMYDPPILRPSFDSIRIQALRQ